MATVWAQTEFSAASPVPLKDLFCQIQVEAFNIDSRAILVFGDVSCISLAF